MSKNPYLDIEIPEAEIKKYNLHIKTMGAYVQTPIEGILGLDIKKIIASVDAKSLYPTIMANGNIGYDSLFGRVYDSDIVEPILTFLELVRSKQTTEERVNGLDRFRSNLVNLINQSNLDSKSNYLKWAPDYYTILFSSLVFYRGSLERVFSPEFGTESDLLRSALFPILEAITWLHKNNPGYNKTIYEYIFYPMEFYDKYKTKKFYLFDNINSSRIKFRVLNIQSFVEYYATKFNLNPYGTLFFRHKDKKSFEVDLILDGMKNRKIIKDRGLMLGAITGGWKKLTDETKQHMYDTQGKIDDLFINNILDVIGDLDAGVRSKQFKTITGIDFNYKEKIEKMSSVDPLEILGLELKETGAQDMGTQNALKVNLNSGYGIYAMATWEYAHSLISNSITSGGKIVGIKLFQQIAHNVLQNELRNRGK